MPFKTLWFWKGPALSDRWASVANYSTEEHPHPSTIHADTSPTSAEPFSYCEIDDSENLVVHLLDEQNAASPDLWYVLEETSIPTEMATIYAVVGNHFAKGSVIPIDKVKTVRINDSEKAGFIRWFRKDSRIQQIYVSEQWRRKRISTNLFAIADIVIVSGNYGPYLNGGDVTTADGEKLRQVWNLSTRVTPRTGSVEN